MYFQVDSLPEYGGLSHRTLEELLESAGARVEVDERKRSPVDFALWKAAKPGEPSWDSPWGTGRPGWHIECSAMSLEILGDGFDLHGGGSDLVFPHHENEIAQALGAGHEFARHWIHNGMLNVNGEKMSKSLGNFTTLADVLDSYDPRAFRMLVLKTHYRRQMEVGDEGAERRGEGRRELRHAVAPGARRSACPTRRRSSRRSSAPRWTTTSTRRPRSRSLQKLRRDANIALDDGRIDDAARLVATVRSLADALGLELYDAATEMEDDVAALVEQRDAARAPKDFAESDRIRDELLARGIVLEDTPNGTVWRRADGPAQGVGLGRSPADRGRAGPARRSAASRSRAGGRCSSCSAPGGVEVRTVSMSSSVRDDPVLDEIRELAGRRSKVVDPERIDELALQRRAAGRDRDGRAVARRRSRRAARGRPTAFLVALDGVSDPRNLGAVARVAETAGATGLVLPAPSQRAASRRSSPRPRPARSNICRSRSPAASRPRSSGRAAPAVGRSVSTRRPTTQSLFDLELADQPLVLVLGSEGRGLARLTARALRRAWCRSRCAARSRRSTSRPPPRSRVTRSVAAGRHYDPDAVAGLAQLAEQLTCNQQVIGSIPIPGSRLMDGPTARRGACSPWWKPSWRGSAFDQRESGPKSLSRQG